MVLRSVSGHQRGTKRWDLDINCPLGDQLFCPCRLSIGQRQRWSSGNSPVHVAIVLASVFPPAIPTNLMVLLFTCSHHSSLPGTHRQHSVARKGPMSTDQTCGPCRRKEVGTVVDWRFPHVAPLYISLFHLCPPATGELGPAREAAPVFPAAHCSPASRRTLWDLPRSGSQWSCPRPQWPDPGESYSTVDPQCGPEPHCDLVCRCPM